MKDKQPLTIQQIIDELQKVEDKSTFAVDQDECKIYKIFFFEQPDELNVSVMIDGW